MKSLFLSLVLLGTSSAFATDATPSSSSQDLYSLAVSNYVSAATGEMKSLHATVDARAAKATPEMKKKFDAVNTKLASCDQLLAQLKTSDRANFDKLKAAYEKARTEAVVALDKVQ